MLYIDLKVNKVLGHDINGDGGEGTVHDNDEEKDIEGKISVVLCIINITEAI